MGHHRPRHRGSTSRSSGASRGPARCEVTTGSAPAASLSSLKNWHTPASLRKGGGLVDAPGRWLVGTKSEYPLRASYFQPKAVTALEKDADVLLTFFDFPAEHMEAPANLERDRVPVRNGAAAAARDQGRGLAHQGAL